MSILRKLTIRKHWKGFEGDYQLKNLHKNCKNQKLEFFAVAKIPHLLVIMSLDFIV